MPYRLRAQTPRTLLALTLLTAPFAACDSSGKDGASVEGTFAATVSGDAQASLGGQAAFAIQTEDGQTVTAVGLLDRADPEDAAFLVFEGRPMATTYRVADEEAGAILVLNGTGDEGTLYIAESGTVTVGRADTSRLSGSFDVTAVSLIDDEDEVRVRGTFDAKPGTVSAPGEN